MTRTAPSLLAALVGVLVLASPASATLLVRSDGAGLLVQDKNGLADSVFVSGVPRDVDPAGGYAVFNGNGGDIFKFDFQVGCRQSPRFGEEAFCLQNSPDARFELGAGSDRLLLSEGYPGSNATVTAGSGDDSVGGANGDCNVTRDGRTIPLPPVAENVIGGPGADRFLGCAGADRLEGGTGNDSLFGGSGRDRLLGGPGTDAITSKEDDGTPAERDRIRCGSGSGDRIVADLQDNIVSGCERIDRSPVGETPHVRLPASALRVSRSGVAVARLSCPGATTIGCRGTLSLKLASRGARRAAGTSYSIRPGRSARVAVRLTASEARRFRSGLRGVLSSLERGRIGPKTTIRTPVLR